MKKSYSLRDRVSARERQYIDTGYYDIVTGEVEKAIQSAEQGRQVYPRDASLAHGLGWHYADVGRFEQAQCRDRVIM